MVKLNSLRDICGIATAVIALSTTAPSAVAQEMTFTFTCQAVGGGAPEPLGDREGHTIQVGEYSCRIDSGPMSGGVTTGRNIWEWDGPNAVMRSDSGVARNAGSTLVWQGTEGKLALTMADGKVTGWTGSGKGANLIATGAAASLAGKPYTWTAKSTGPATWTIESKE
ncbi:hypothetical protein [Roseiarcus sp.]|uniref:hypothetical protein n=1 Tax=Roseiarcus sp. TaxID=1969460 RepID=UPI003F99B3E4